MKTEKNEKRRKANIEFLESLGTPFEAYNNGKHLVIQNKNKAVDFWPGTEKWHCRESGKYSAGLERMLEYLGLK